MSCIISRYTSHDGLIPEKKLKTISSPFLQFLMSCSSQSLHRSVKAYPYREREKNICLNYRGISLLVISFKILAAIWDSTEKHY
jgi:hypothetical protein